MSAARTNGFSIQDVRTYSRWALSIDGSPIRVSRAPRRLLLSAGIWHTPDGTTRTQSFRLIQRDRIVGGGVHEDYGSAITARSSRGFPSS